MTEPRSTKRSVPTANHRAFTIIELLVVVSIISLLVSILLPALSHSRLVAKQVREMAGAQQLMISYHIYANDNNDMLLPGRLKENMVRSLTLTGEPLFRVVDDQGRLLQEDAAQRYPWRLAPYVDNYNFSGMILDRQLLVQYAQRPSRTFGSEAYRKQGYQYAYSNNPTFGINASYLGGDHTDHCPVNTTFLSPEEGSLFRDRRDLVDFGDRIIVFASARGPHVDSQFTDARADIVTGSHTLTPPVLPASGFSPGATGNQRAPYHNPTLQWDPQRAAQDFGFLDLRHPANKGVTAMFDGHVEMLGLDDFRDMRHWTPLATTPDWLPGGNGVRRPPPLGR